MATSSIRITKICQWCGVEFEAQKVSTKYCSHRCANLAYKQAVRDKRVKQAENETHYVKTEKPVENIKDKEYLSIAQAATDVQPRDAQQGGGDTLYSCTVAHQ